MTSNSFTQTSWSLADLFPSADSPEIETAITQLQAAVADFEKVRPQLTDTITRPDFLKIVHQLEAVYRQAATLNGFAGLRFNENTQNQQAQTFMARIDQLNAEMSNRILFFSLWWKALDDDQAERLLQAAGDYHYWLEEIRQL